MHKTKTVNNKKIRRKVPKINKRNENKATNETGTARTHNTENRGLNFRLKGRCPRKENEERARQDTKILGRVKQIALHRRDTIQKQRLFNKRTRHSKKGQRRKVSKKMKL